VRTSDDRFDWRDGAGSLLATGRICYWGTGCIVRRVGWGVRLFNSFYSKLWLVLAKELPMSYSLNVTCLECLEALDLFDKQDFLADSSVNYIMNLFMGGGDAF